MLLKIIDSIFQVFRTIETDSQKIIEKVSYPQMEVEEIIEEPSTEGIVESSLNEGEFLPQPAVETAVNHQPEETAEDTEGFHRTVSRHSDSFTTRRQVIRRHIQVSMVKKIHDDEAKSSEEEEIEEELEEEASLSSDEHPSEEVEFKPMVRERSRVIRTAVRKSARDPSARKVIRKHETETSDVPLPLEVSGLPRSIQIEEEIVPESPTLTEVYTEPGLYFETRGGEKIGEEPKVTRFVQRQEDVPSSRRQVIRSIVREKFTITAREAGKDLIEDQNGGDTSANLISSEDEGDQGLIEHVADEGGKEGIVTRLAIRGDEHNVTHRQVYRIVEAKINLPMEYENEAKPQEVIDEKVLPEPSYSAFVEEEPDYLGDLVEEHHIKNVASDDDDEPTVRRTILRTPEDAITRRQVIRRRVKQTESVVLHMHSEDEEEESSSGEEETVADINGVYENGLNGEEGIDLELIREDLPRKFDHLRTAVRREEHLPISRRQVYRKRDIAMVKEELKNQMNVEKDKTVESGGRSLILYHRYHHLFT